MATTAIDTRPNVLNRLDYVDAYRENERRNVLAARAALPTVIAPEPTYAPTPRPELKTFVDDEKDRSIFFVQTGFFSTDAERVADKAVDEFTPKREVVCQAETLKYDDGNRDAEDAYTSIFDAISEDTELSEAAHELAAAEERALTFAEWKDRQDKSHGPVTGRFYESKPPTVQGELFQGLSYSYNFETCSFTGKRMLNSWFDAQRSAYRVGTVKIERFSQVTDVWYTLATGGRYSVKETRFVTVASCRKCDWKVRTFLTPFDVAEQAYVEDAAPEPARSIHTYRAQQFILACLVHGNVTCSYSQHRPWSAAIPTFTQFDFERWQRMIRDYAETIEAGPERDAYLKHARIFWSAATQERTVRVGA